MTQASKETIESAIELNSSLRVGCYYNAIMKVHRHFETVGIPRWNFQKIIYKLFGRDINLSSYL